MKKILLLSIFSFYIGAAIAQDVIYTVSGELNNNKVPLDSILVENLSNNTWISFNNLPGELYYQINLTKKAYWGTTSVSSFDNNLPGFVESQNIPGEITLTYNNSIPTKARFSVFSINGQEIYSSAKQTLIPGNSVQVNLAQTGVFLVRVESDLGTQSFKGIGLPNAGNYNVSVIYNANFNIQTKSGQVTVESDFEFADGDSLRISIYKNEYYAQPKSKMIVNSESINFQLKQSEVILSGISDSYIELIAENTEIEEFDKMSGNVTVNFNGESPEFIPGSIICVDVDTMGFLRKVSNVINNIDGSITLETRQAYLNEIFVNKEINLDTELINRNKSLRSNASKTEISKALTDDNGYIHPVKIIYHYDTGNKIKSAINENSSEDGTVPLFDVGEDFSNTTIFQNGNAHFYIDEGHSKLNGNATFYFFFKEGTEIDPESKIKKGELDVFSYNMKNTFDFKTNLKLEITDSYSSENSTELLKPKSVTAKFLVGTVPVWITFNLSFHGKYTISADASVVAGWGFQNKISSNTGAAFSNETGDFVQNSPTYTENLIIDPLKIEGNFNLNARLELYPRIEAMVYSFVGPFVELVPYTTGEVKVKASTEITSEGTKDFWAWNSNVAAGFDTRVGAKLNFAGLFEDEEFGPIELNLYDNIIWEAPKTLTLISEIPKEVAIGDTVNVEFEVFDSENNSVAGCPIYFLAEGSTKDSILVTGTNGKAIIDWIVQADENGDNKTHFSAKIYDGDKNIVGEISKTIDLSFKNLKNHMKVGETNYDLSHGYIFHEYDNKQIVQSILVLCSENRTWDRTGSPKFPGTGSFIAFEITSSNTTGFFTGISNELDNIWFQSVSGKDIDATGDSELEITEEGGRTSGSYIYEHGVFTISFSADNVSGYFKGELELIRALYYNCYPYFDEKGNYSGDDCFWEEW